MILGITKVYIHLFEQKIRKKKYFFQKKFFFFLKFSKKKFFSKNWKKNFFEFFFHKNSFFEITTSPIHTILSKIKSIDNLQKNELCSVKFGQKLMTLCNKELVLKKGALTIAHLVRFELIKVYYYVIVKPMIPTSNFMQRIPRKHQGSISFFAIFIYIFPTHTPFSSTC